MIMRSQTTCRPSKFLYSLVLFFTPLMAATLYYHNHTMPFAYIFVFLDLKFWMNWLLHGDIFSRRNVLRTSLTAILCLALILYSSMPMLITIKLAIITSFIIYCFHGMKHYSFTPLISGVICSVIFALFQFIEINIFKTAYLSVENLTFSITNQLGIGYPLQQFGSYSPGILPHFGRLIRVSGPTAEPGIYCALLLALWPIMRARKDTKLFSIAGFVFALSKAVPIQAIALVFYRFIANKLRVSLLIALMIGAYILVGNLYANHYHIQAKDLIPTSKDVAQPTFHINPSDTLGNNLANSTSSDNFGSFDYNGFHGNNESIRKRLSGAIIFYQEPWRKKITGIGNRYICVNVKTTHGTKTQCAARYGSNLGSLLQSYGIIGILMMLIFFEYLCKSSNNEAETKYLIFVLLLSTLILPFLQFLPAHYLLIAYIFYSTTKADNYKEKITTISASSRRLFSAQP